VKDSRTSGSKETAMPTRRFERIALAQILASGCAIAFSAFILIELAQAQPGYVPPPPPLPPPTLNPSNPGTVPQPSYKPITPSTPSTTPSTQSTVPSVEAAPRANEEHRSTTAQSQQPSEPRTVHHHHHHRAHFIGLGPALGSYNYGYLGGVRLYPWAFPCQYYSAYCYPYGYYQRYGWYGY
jgi:hypothetical protein